MKNIIILIFIVLIVGCRFRNNEDSNNSKSKESICSNTINSRNKIYRKKLKDKENYHRDKKYSKVEISEISDNSNITKDIQNKNDEIKQIERKIRKVSSNNTFSKYFDNQSGAENENKKDDILDKTSNIKNDNYVKKDLNSSGFSNKIKCISYDLIKPGFNLICFCKECQKCIIKNLGFDPKKYDKYIEEHDPNKRFLLGNIITNIYCDFCKKRIYPKSISDIVLHDCHYKSIYIYSGASNEEQGFVSNFNYLLIPICVNNEILYGSVIIELFFRN